MLSPFVGAILHYRATASDALGNPPHNDSHMEPRQPLAALVVYVWNERLVNLTVFDANGVGWPRPNVVFVPAGDDHVPSDAPYCEWPVSRESDITPMSDIAATWPYTDHLKA